LQVSIGLRRKFGAECCRGFEVRGAIFPVFGEFVVIPPGFDTQRQVNLTVKPSEQPDRSIPKNPSFRIDG